MMAKISLIGQIRMSSLPSTAAVERRRSFSHARRLNQVLSTALAPSGMSTGCYNYGSRIVPKCEASRTQVGRKHGSSGQDTTAEGFRPSEFVKSPLPANAAAAAPPADASEAVGEAHPYVDLYIGKRWREIQGANNWEGLLEPLDPHLRGEVVRYGEHAQSTYDAFDHDEFSTLSGSCKFKEENFFPKVYLANRGYEITRYIYCATQADMRAFKYFLHPDPEINTDESWTERSNWMGYVAVCTSQQEIARLGRRDIVVAWRGTVINMEWVEDAELSLCPTGIDGRRIGQGSSPVDLKVEQGFLSMYTAKDEASPFSKDSARDQVLGAIIRLMEEYKDEELSITLTGHSLGAALATLCAYDIAQSGINRRISNLPEDDNSMSGAQGQIQTSSEWYDQHAPDSYGGNAVVPVTVFNFGSPRVGNNAFHDRVDELNVKVLRVVNIHDWVPRVPGFLFNETLKHFSFRFPKFRDFILVRLLAGFIDRLPITYSHVGEALYIDNLQSPFLKYTLSPPDVHNLETYLHIVDGLLGLKSGGFSKQIAQRDKALVNKMSAILKHSEKVPPNWWQDHNKGLVLNANGRFVCGSRDMEDVPQQPLPEPYIVEPGWD